MNILILSETFYPHYGGAELATYLYSKLLSQGDTKVVVITNRHEGENETSRYHNLVIHRLNLFKTKESTKYSTFLRIDLFFSNFFKKIVNWADLVYIPRLWFSAIPYIKKYRKPVIVHLHDYFPICPMSNIYDFSQSKICEKKGFSCNPECIWIYERSQNRNTKDAILSIGLNTIIGKNIGKLVALSDAIICVSKEHKNILLDYYPSLKGKTHFIYNPLPEISKIRLENEDFGYFGGLNSLKGFHVLSEAMKRYNGNKVRVHATKFPSIFNRNNFNYLNVDFIPHGRLDSNEFNSLYKKVETVIVPSIWPEPLPYVVLEALLRGRLLIASRIGGIPEEIEGCKGVSICEPGNAVELADAMVSIRNYSEEDKQDWRIHNNKIIMSKFNNKKSIEKFMNICVKIIQ